MAETYQEAIQKSRELSNRMRMGVGVSSLLKSPQAPTHYIDTLEMFQKDFAAYDRQKRQEEMQKRHKDLQRRRIEQLERQSRRWQLMEQYDRKLKSRQEQNLRLQQSGIRRIGNRNGLPYNPINLQYENNPEGERLKYEDEQTKIRGFVRAHNMDKKGNCKYNLLNGSQRIGVEYVVPQGLKSRFDHRLHEHYDGLRIKVPQSNYSIRSNKYF